MELKRKQSGVIYTSLAIPEYALQSGFPYTVRFTSGGTVYAVPALLETTAASSKYIEGYDTSNTRYNVVWYDKSSPTHKFTKGGKVYATINKSSVTTDPYNSPSIKSITLGSVSYGSWSGWTSVSGGQKRTRSFSVTATIVLTSQYDAYKNFYRAYVDRVQCYTTGSSVSVKASYTSDKTVTLTVSGSGTDYTSLNFYVYDKLGYSASSKSVNCTIDAYEFQSE